MSEILARPVEENAAAVRGGRLSAVELAEVALAEFERWEKRKAPPLNAFLALDGDDVLRQARAVDERVARGDDPGPLAGIPVAIKDNICVQGLPTTCGSKILEGYRSPFEATAVRRLRAAGAVIFGKTNLDEFAMGSSTENSAFGPTRNPIDPARVPGGSSGGSAAAVAAGIVPLALGSETGGSVRQPAALCGVVGVKPTYGRVSRYGLVAFGSSLDQIGTLGRRVRDALILLQIISGHDRFDATSGAVPVPDFGKAWDDGARGLTVGLPREYFTGDLDPAIAARCQEAWKALESAGARMREVSLPHTPYAIPAYYLVAPAEASSNLARYDGVRYGPRAPSAESAVEVFEATREVGFGREVKRRIMLGTYALSAGYYEAYYGRAMRVRAKIADDFVRAFESGVDVIFTPTSPTVAFKLGERVEDPIQMYLSDVFTVTANLAGVPAISVPIGRVDGLPVGGQLIARRWEEVTLARAAAALERALA